MTAPDDDHPREPDEASLPAMDGDLSALTAEEVRRRTEAPLPRSLTDFLR